jgi:hypothetical protein
LLVVVEAFGVELWRRRLGCFVKSSGVGSGEN